MKLRFKQYEEWPDGSKGGMAEVVEACCGSVRDMDSGWYLTCRNGLLYAGLAMGFDDLAADIPFRFCPSCGVPVEVVSWEAEREYVQPVIYSGEPAGLKWLPRDYQGSGQPGTYGTLPNDEREGGPA